MVAAATGFHHEVGMGGPQPPMQIYSTDLKSDPWHLVTTMTHAPWDYAQLQVHQWQPPQRSEAALDAVGEDAQM